LEIAALEFVVVAGAMLGGFVAVHFMSDPSNVSINPKPLSWLNLVLMRRTESYYR
jgi:hypothetical protein